MKLISLGCKDYIIKKLSDLVNPSLNKWLWYYIPYGGLKIKPKFSSKNILKQKWTEKQKDVFLF